MKDRFRVGEIINVPNQPPAEKDIIINWGQWSDPLVSIICHSYNHEKFIEDALKGFLCQITDFPYEIIIRDDFSVDDTVKIIEQYVARYPRLIKPIYETSNTYSKGISPQKTTFPRALGEYIAFCEGDDYWLGSNKLQKQIDAMKFDSKIAVSYHSSVVINNGYVCLGYKDRARDLDPDELVRKPYGICNASKVYRNIPEFKDGSFPKGDSTLCVFVAKYGGCKYIPDCGPAVYRQHAGGVWSMVDGEVQRRITLNSFINMYSIVLGTGNKNWINSRRRELLHELISYDIFYSLYLILRLTAGRLWRSVRFKA